MEGRGLLKYWKSAGGASCPSAAAVDHPAAETDEEDGGEEGPFFEMEFAVPEEEEERKRNAGESLSSSPNCTDEVTEMDGRTDHSLRLSPPEPDGDGDKPFTALESSSPVSSCPESVSVASKNQFPVSLLKSTTKFRVFMLRFKKSKAASERADSKGSAASAEEAPGARLHQKTKEPQPPAREEERRGGGESEFVRVKLLKVVEEVPIASLFTRQDSSSKGGSKRVPVPPPSSAINPPETQTVADERRFRKYMKLVKPFYVRVSRRYGEKLRLSGKLRSSGEAAVQEVASSEIGAQRQGNIKAGVRLVGKRLGKSRSASATVAAAPPLPAGAGGRRDDSLLEQQDGIQSAILHCKRSFNASRDSDASGLHSRSSSDPSHAKLVDLSRRSCSDDLSEIKI